jgi:hypothetical protein
MAKTNHIPHFGGWPIDGGGWVEGYHVFCRGRHYILQAYNENGYDERWLEEWVEVHPDSVSMAMGWKDTNGKDIFDGAIGRIEYGCVANLNTSPHILDGTVRYKYDTAMWIFDYRHGELPLSSDCFGEIEIISSEWEQK